MNIDIDLLSVLVGAVAAIVGGIIGGWVQGWAWYRYEQKRAAAEEKKRWVERALEWADTGRLESFRRATLRGADLRHVDLGPGPGRWGYREDGADLSFSDLSKATLYRANLERANLEGANLQETMLQATNLQGAFLMDANLQGAFLVQAYLRGAYLWGAHLQGAKYNNDTTWPERFTPPPEAVNLDASADDH